jgi:hypothetical protein
VLAQPGNFSVNGLRSRANNFTVDGSDNNDEDIGVRRQGFVALVPQPIESVQEYQVITLLAPAQFGRNVGGQINAVSKSGGNETHGHALLDFQLKPIECAQFLRHNLRQFDDGAASRWQASVTEWQAADHNEMKAAAKILLRSLKAAW